MAPPRRLSLPQLTLRLSQLANRPVRYSRVWAAACSGLIATKILSGARRTVADDPTTIAAIAAKLGLKKPDAVERAKRPLRRVARRG